MQFKFFAHLTAVSLFSFAAFAQNPNLGSSNKEFSNGTVERLTSSLGVVLKHGEVKNIDLGAGSTEFRALNIELFQKLRIGQQIVFRAEKREGRYTIVMIQP